MTLDEALVKADNGDVGAMMALGDYYHDVFLETFTSDEFSSAIKWYELAAMHGVLRAKIRLIKLHTMDAITRSTLYGTLYHPLEIYHSWNQTKYWCQSALVDCSSMPFDKESEDLISFIKHELDESTYQCSLYLYMCDKPTEALSLIADLHDTRANLLRGICQTDLAENDTQMKEAFDNLSHLQNDLQYAKKEKSTCEEMIFFGAACQIACMYRNFFKPYDLKKAYDILTFAKYYLRDPDCIEGLNDELAKYKKKLFGGYKYIG